jgi:hypothetical protein
MGLLERIMSEGLLIPALLEEVLSVALEGSLFWASIRFKCSKRLLMISKLWGKENFTDVLDAPGPHLSCCNVLSCCECFDKVDRPFEGPHSAFERRFAMGSDDGGGAGLIYVLAKHSLAECHVKISEFSTHRLAAINYEQESCHDSE